MSVLLLIHAETGAVEGYVASSSLTPVVLPSKRPIVSMEVPREHPALYDHVGWHAPRRIILGAAWGRILQRRAEINDVVLPIPPL